MRSRLERKWLRAKKHANGLSRRLPLPQHRPTVSRAWTEASGTAGTACQCSSSPVPGPRVENPRTLYSPQIPQKF
eukprot:4727648-Amphidinium_carterae.1